MNSTCVSATYATYSEASIAQRELRKQRRIAVTIYLCSKCDNFHFRGHEKRMRMDPKAREVLKMIMLGHDYLEIAKYMNMTPRVVRYYMQELNFAFGSSSSAQTVAMAIALGFIDPRSYLPQAAEKCNGAA